MKNPKLLLLPLAALLFSACGGGTEEAEIPLEERSFGVRSGILEYTESGPELPYTSKTTHYFDDWGVRQAMYAEATTADGEVMRRLQLKAGEWAYSANLDKMTGAKGKVAETPPMVGGPVAAHEARVLAEGGKLEGTEEFLGYTCKVFVENPEALQGTVRNLVYEAILLKSTITGDDGKVIYRREATRFEENADVPQDKLMPPSGVNFVSAEAVNQALQQADAAAQAREAESPEETEAPAAPQGE